MPLVEINHSAKSLHCMRTMVHVKYLMQEVLYQGILHEI